LAGTICARTDFVASGLGSSLARPSMALRAIADLSRP
jgi:hypothetical protein